jgi:hypothetical protein
MTSDEPNISFTKMGAGRNLHRLNYQMAPLLSRKDPLVLTQKGPLQDREFEQDSELQRCGFLLATWSGEFREPEEVNLEGHARKGH